MMHGRGKSDPGIVAVKPANNAEQSAAELVEPRTGTKGNADQQSTRRAQYRESVSQALGRIRQVSPSSTRGRSRMHKGARPDLCGGRGATRVPTATQVCPVCQPSLFRLLAVEAIRSAGLSTTSRLPSPSPSTA